MRQSLGGIGFWLTCKEKAGWAGRQEEAGVPAGRGGGGGGKRVLSGCGWGRTTGGAPPRPWGPHYLHCQPPAPGVTEESLDLPGWLFMSHPSCNKHVPAGRPQ